MKMEEEKRKQIVEFLGNYLGARKNDFGQEDADIALSAIRRLWHTFHFQGVFEDLTNEEIKIITEKIR